MKKVLIVDDAAFIRVSLKMMIDKNGFEVVGEAENGLIAISKYRQLRPDIVTMDITMPELDGIDAIKMIKGIDKNAKIVVISAMGQETLVRKAILAGAANFIVKPFNEEKVVETLNSL